MNQLRIAFGAAGTYAGPLSLLQAPCNPKLINFAPAERNHHR
eukprot:COSAG02_NODE_50158_length_322_cov_0.887892_1_plen_41_part_10